MSMNDSQPLFMKEGYQKFYPFLQPLGSICTAATRVKTGMKFWSQPDMVSAWLLNRIWKKKRSRTVERDAGGTKIDYFL